jgi:hypothetical protein
MAAFDEPLHVGGKHQSESERRRGIANQPANSFQIVNIPISSCGRELLQRVHGFLALDQFCLGYTHGGCGSVHLPMASDRFCRFGQRCHDLAKLGHNHRPLTTICTARLGSLNEREHLLNLGNALDYARDGNDFSGIIAEFRGE